MRRNESFSDAFRERASAVITRAFTKIFVELSVAKEKRGPRDELRLTELVRDAISLSLKVATLVLEEGNIDGDFVYPTYVLRMPVGDNATIGLKQSDTNGVGPNVWDIMVNGRRSDTLAVDAEVVTSDGSFTVSSEWSLPTHKLNWISADPDEGRDDGGRFVFFPESPTKSRREFSEFDEEQAYKNYCELMRRVLAALQVRISGSGEMPSFDSSLLFTANSLNFKS